MSDTAAGGVQITADALIHLRAKSPLARRLAIECPYDHLFLTEAGADLARMAQSLDPVYEPFNLARYAWFTRRMAAHAARYRQIVVLGAGYDTRSLALPALRDGGCRIFELDYGDVLSVKRRVLAGAGVALPEGLRYVPCDLDAEDPRGPLAAAGFDASAPSAAVMEGVFFFLRGDRAAALLRPAAIGLAPGSVLTFDAWTAMRARTLNEKLMRSTGRRLFGDAPLGDGAEDAAAALRQQGYGEIRVIPLGEIARDYGADAVADPMENSWLVLEGLVPKRPAGPKLGPRLSRQRARGTPG